MSNLKFHGGEAANGSLKFHGLSSPEDLINMWRILKRDNDANDINIIWDYETPSQLENGFNIVNIKYNPKAPDETGHYCLIHKLDDAKSILYYNPVAEYTDLDVDKILDLYVYFVKEKEWPEDNLLIDLSGKQKATSENCGYHCLAKAFTIYTDRETGGRISRDAEFGGAPIDAKHASSPNDSPEDLLYSILKNVRGIYFGLRDGWQDSTRPRPKAKGASSAGAGLADHVASGQNWTFSRLRDKIEN